MPKPRVAIADQRMPNAFAIGRSPKTATVCATTGILDLLDDAELDGVLAHELTHVRNRDVLVMTIASFFASIAAFIVQMGFWFGGAFDNRDKNNGPAFIVVILVSAVVYVVSWLLLQALSRYREFAADRGSAIITGRPSALIQALLKIEGGMAQIPKQDLRVANNELAAFYIFPPKAKQAWPPCSRRTRRWRSGSRRCSGSRPSCRAPPVSAARDRQNRGHGLPRRLVRQAQVGPAGSRPAVRDEHRLRDAGDLAEHHDRRQCAIVFQPLSTADFEGIVRDMEEVVRGTAADSGTTVESSDDSYGFRWLVLRPVVRGPGRRDQRGLERARGRRLRRPHPVRGVRVRGLQQAPDVLDLQLQARRLLPVRPRRRRAAARQRARARAQGADRRELPVEQELERWFPLWGIPI